MYFQYLHFLTSLKKDQVFDKKLIEMEKRFLYTQIEFSNFDLRLIETKPFILVSFGSVAKVSLYV